MLQKIATLGLLLAVVHCFIQIESAYNLTVNDLDHSLVRVVQDSSNLKILPNLQIQYFSLTIENKQKSKSFNLFKHKYNKILQVLKHFYQISSESEFVKSQIKSRYIPRSKLWQFSSSFAIVEHQKYKTEILQKLENLGVKILKDNVQIRYLKQKWMSSRIFAAAKLQLEERLSRISRDLEIKHVDGIQIQGLNDYEEEERIQFELQSEDIQDFSDSEMMADFCEKYDEFAKEDIKMEVIFRVGKKKNSLQYRNSKKLNQSLLLDDFNLEISEQQYQQQ